MCESYHFWYVVGIANYNRTLKRIPNEADLKEGQAIRAQLGKRSNSKNVVRAFLVLVLYTIVMGAAIRTSNRSRKKGMY